MNRPQTSGVLTIPERVSRYITVRGDRPFTAMDCINTVVSADLSALNMTRAKASVRSTLKRRVLSGEIGFNAATKTYSGWSKA